MELLKAILEAQNGGAVDQIANQLGLDRGAAENVIGQIAPALGRGLARNSESQGGLDSLLGALQKSNHQQYLDDPRKATQESGINEGNQILGHILGNKDVSRQLASRASEQTGVSDSLIKKMLPMIATIAMGALSNRSNQAPESGSALGGILGAFLGGGANNSNANSGGLDVDDLLDLAGKFLNR